MTASARPGGVPILSVFEVAAAVGISALIALDDEAYWLEGALLMIVSAILAISLFVQQPA